MEDAKSIYENLSDEQKERLKTMTPQDIIDTATKEGIDLTPEQLQAISGGTSALDKWINGEHASE